MNKDYSVELTPLAEKQILQLAEYIIEEFQAPETAKRVVDRIESELSKLSKMPERIVVVTSEPWRSKGVHKYVMGNYIAYFVVDEADMVVRVTAVVLDRMNQKKQLSKMEL
jgi:plasmid stabilization system protein ParE